MNILVTGANGFIGSHIINELSNKFSFFKGTRQTIDLFSPQSIESYLKENKIDTIIHCAIVGGKRTEVDSENVYADNLRMYQNLIRFRTKIDKFINIASGAEFDKRNNIEECSEEELYVRSPHDFYGSSKNYIARDVLKNKSVNIRVFGCFDYNEADFRFIRSNIKLYIEHQPLTIHNNKLMDFIYMKDLTTIVNHYIVNKPVIFDLNAVYKTKTSLLYIADRINRLANYHIPINIMDDTGLSYTGNGNKLELLNLPLVGLDQGIKECYNKLL